MRKNSSTGRRCAICKPTITNPSEKKYGLDRGKEGSTAKHLDTVTFKTKKMKEEAVAKVLEADERERQAQEKISEAERLQREVEPVRKLLDDYE